MPKKEPTGMGADLAMNYGTITPLTGAFGSPGSAIVDVTASPTQTTINNNFRALEDKLNQIITILQSMGVAG